MNFSNKELLKYSKNCSVLYVEDNDALRESTCRLFSNYFEQIDTACDGKRGLDHYKNYYQKNQANYDLVITDINMPLMNGIEMCQEILSYTPDQAILLISAHDEVEMLHQAMEIGVNGFLVKPLDGEQIRKAIFKICRSISDRKDRNSFYEQLEIQLLAQRKKLEELYRIDALTGLENIHALMQSIGEVKGGSLALININKFHEINEYYGHFIGDSILQQLAELLLNHFDGVAKVFRGHNDEFVLLALPSITLTKLDSMLESLRNILMTETFAIDGKAGDSEMTLPIQVSIGLAGGDGDLLMSAASALHKAKKNHNGKICFDESLSIKQTYQENFAMVKRVHKAIMDYRIITHYQPIVENSSKKIVKYEALARLIDQNGAILLPGLFLDVSKKARLYEVISQTVLQQACATFRNRHESFSVNVDLEDILNPKTRIHLLEMIDSLNEPNRMIIELVETEQMEQTPILTNFILELKKRGCKLSIDDFGTGYSNFEYLTRLEPDIIKIDGSLIKNILTTPRSFIIVEAIVQFAQKMGIQTVAEYVENREIYEIIHALGITYSQGYYFGKPQMLDSHS